MIDGKNIYEKFRDKELPEEWEKIQAHALGWNEPGL